MALEDLLKGVLGGGQQDGQGANDSTPDLTDLLGGILGGLGGAQPQRGTLPGGGAVPQPQGGAQLPDLIGAFWADFSRAGTWGASWAGPI